MAVTAAGAGTKHTPRCEVFRVDGMATKKEPIPVKNVGSTPERFSDVAATCITVMHRVD